MAYNWNAPAWGTAIGAGLGALAAPVTGGASLLPFLAAGAGTGAVGGGLFGLFGKKKKAEEENPWNYYTSPDYTRLRDVLYNAYAQGIPGLEDWGKGIYNRGIEDLRERYETKRNPYGGAWSDTPEFAQAAKYGSDLTSNLTEQQMRAKMGALSSLAQITGQGGAFPYRNEEEPSDLENLFSFGAPLASTALSGYLQSKDPMNILLKKYLMNSVKPSSYENFYNTKPNNSVWGNQWPTF